MKCSKIFYLIFIFFLISFISVFVTKNIFENKDINKVKEEQKVDKNLFSMFIENEYGNYDEYIESNTFPDGYTLNKEKSGCVDTKGNILENVLSNESNNITVTSNTTAFCYLYFDIDPLNKILQSNDLWESTLEDDGYRFVGTNPANYICFGTTDTSTCTGNTDLYMYRIIGIFEDSSGKKHLKLIKKEALNTSYEWHEDFETDTDWDESDLYKGINGSYFLSNTTYSYMQDKNWTNKIADWDYTTANTLTNESMGPDYNSETVTNVYLHEMNRDSKTSTIGEWKTVNAKIGLMYVSDYFLSLGSSALNYTGNSNYSTLKTGWMHITNNDSASLSTTAVAPPSSYEWTMSRYGFDGYYQAYDVYPGGSSGWRAVSFLFSVRPVFYLTSDVTISGEGTSTNPYIIS